MSGFKWTRKRKKVVFALAEGYTVEEAAELAQITERTVYRWKNNLDFSTEVDRLSLLIGIASRAERLRIATRVAREKVKDDVITTGKDLLDWLKFAQSETDGAKLDLAALFEAMEATTESEEGPSPESDGAPETPSGEEGHESSQEDLTAPDASGVDAPLPLDSG